MEVIVYSIVSVIAYFLIGSYVAGRVVKVYGSGGSADMLFVCAWPFIFLGWLLYTMRHALAPFKLMYRIGKGE